MDKTLQLTHTKVGDIPLLLGLVIKLNIPAIYDREIGDHGLHAGLSGGWMLANWTVFILTESDHTKYNVEDWVGRHAELLSRLTGQQMRAGDFNDNRLSSVLSRLSKVEGWERFEAAVWRISVSVYEILKPGVGELYSAHCDSTMASGYHQVHEHGVMQRGHSKDHRPDLAQLKLMTMAVHPYGQLIATRVARGETADDGLYLPLIARTRQMLGRIGVLYVSDSKMAALATRAQIAQQGDYYLTVAPLKGETQKSLPAWIEVALSGAEPLTTLRKENGELIGQGYEFRCPCTAQLPTGPDGTLEAFTFSERVQVIQSEDLRAAQSKSLRDQLRRAQAEIKALTPEPRQGRPQYGDEENFKAALCAVIEKHKVAGLLNVNWEVEERKQVKLIGRGRAGADRPKREVVRRRCQVKSVSLDRKAIAAALAPTGLARAAFERARRSFAADLCDALSRELARERNYNRLKGEPIGIDPIFVRNDDQITGLTNLLAMAVRVESLIEVQVARGLQSEGKEIKGLYPGLPKRGDRSADGGCDAQSHRPQGDHLDPSRTQRPDVSSAFALAGVVARCLALLASVANSLCRLAKEFGF